MYLVEPVDLSDAILAGDIECECALCDLPLDFKHEPITWKLLWRFTGPPAAVRGEYWMLLCDHCLHEWVDNWETEFYGGEPVKYFPV